MLKIISLIASIAFGCVVVFFIWLGVVMWKGEERARQDREDQRSGKWDFGDQPALFAVAQAIVRNDQEAIRATAGALPDLHTPGRDGATLLYFAVRRSWQHPEMIDAVKTLLALGADPNYTNGQRNSFAMANAVHASEPVLRAMLDAGGNPNTRDEFDQPIICMNWYLGYYEAHERARLHLLLERGADVNSTMPPDRFGSGDGRYTLLLYRMRRGVEDPPAYADALLLLERGADPQRVGDDGMTFAKMLVAHREQFSRENKAPPRQFTPLWDWAQTHGIFRPPE